MRRTLVLLSCTIILLVAAAHVYRDPRVQELFRSLPAGTGTAKKRVLPPALPKPSEAPARSATSAAATSLKESPPPARHRGTARPHPNQTPNETVSRVLFQILAAKGLARGISLEVSDGSIAIYGEVASEDMRQQIVGVIEKGREGRRLDVSGLGVRP